MTSHPRLAVLIALMVSGTLSCSGGRDRSITVISTESVPCPEHGIAGDVTCHQVTVPENPELPEGRAIGLEVMVLQARAGETLEDPLFVIPGGPGQSATRSAGPRSYFASVFDGVREQRDVVLLAPRGTAGSSELALEPAPERLFDELFTVVPGSWARDARPRLESRADLEMYTTSHIVDDIEAIRRALGYRRLNIYGTSYGTRVAQVFAVRYPEQVRALILKAPVPPTAIVPLTYTTGAQRALDRLFDLCGRQEACEAAYPDLESRFGELMTRLEQTPVVIRVSNPFSAQQEDVRVDDAVLGYVLRNLMMPASGGATTLAVIDLASRGDFSPLATAIPQMRAGYATALAGGMMLSVIASEDAPRVTDAMLREDERSGFLRGAVARGMMRTAAEWPRAEVAGDVHEFLEGDTPTLIVTGEFDPATPPPFAEEIADRLSNARVVVFPGGAHSANNFGGLGRIMEEFVRTARVDDLDLSAVRDNRPLPLVRSR